MPEFFRKTARSKLKSVLMAVSFFLASTAAADTGADARGSIITDNFALVASGSEDALPGPLARDPEGSAYLGSCICEKGERKRIYHRKPDNCHLFKKESVYTA